MAQIAKRKARESWRDAVAARAGEAGVPAALEVFDDMVRGGSREAEAAYRALAAHGLLWPVGGTPETPPHAAPEPHAVPDV